MRSRRRRRWTAAVFALWLISTFLWILLFRLNLAADDLVLNDHSPGDPLPRNQHLELPGDLDLAALPRQRLKPWWDWRILVDSEAQDCPQFTRCSRGGRSMRRVHFCRTGYREIGGRPFRHALDLHGRRLTRQVAASRLPPWMEIRYQPHTLPWDGHLVRIDSDDQDALFVNEYGQTFTRSRQYLHGGCQDVDVQAGPRRVYRADKTSVQTIRGGALLMVHCYGDNFYHFLVEVVPRFFLALPLLRKWPQLSVIVHPRTPVTLLHALLPDLPAQLKLVYAQAGTLLRMDGPLYMPMSLRCLHPNQHLMAAVRQEWSHGLWSRLVAMSRGHLHSVGVGDGIVENHVDGSKKMVDVENHDAFSGFRPDWTGADTRGPLQITYFSRINTHPRRYLHDEPDFIHALMEMYDLQLDRTKSGPTTGLVYRSRRPFPFMVDEGPVVEPAVGMKTTGGNSSRFMDTQSNRTIHARHVLLRVLYGNETLHPTLLPVMQSTHLLISTHGAQLSNMMFMRTTVAVPAATTESSSSSTASVQVIPVTRILELSPHRDYWNPCFLYLSSVLGIPYTVAWLDGHRSSVLRFRTSDNATGRQSTDNTTQSRKQQDRTQDQRELASMRQVMLWTRTTLSRIAASLSSALP